MYLRASSRVLLLKPYLFSLILKLPFCNPMQSTYCWLTWYMFWFGCHLCRKVLNWFSLSLSSLLVNFSVSKKIHGDCSNCFIYLSDICIYNIIDRRKNLTFFYLNQHKAHTKKQILVRCGNFLKLGYRINQFWSGLSLSQGVCLTATN